MLKRRLWRTDGCISLRVSGRFLLFLNYCAVCRDTSVFPIFPIPDSADLSSPEYVNAFDAILKRRWRDYSSQQAMEVAERTKGQRDNEEWCKLRATKLTASRFGLVLSNHRPTTPMCSIIRRVMYPTYISHIPAVAHGIKNEPLVLEEYKRRAVAGGRNIEVKTTGLWICTEPNYAFLGATPDAIVKDMDRDGEKYLIEVCIPLLKAF